MEEALKELDGTLEKYSAYQENILDDFSKLLKTLRSKKFPWAVSISIGEDKHLLWSPVEQQLLIVDGEKLVLLKAPFVLIEKAHGQLPEFIEGIKSIVYKNSLMPKGEK